MITLQPGEKILMEVHKHWLSIIVHAIFHFLIALIVAIVMPFVFSTLWHLYPSVISNSNFQAALLFFEVAWLWFIWVMFWVMWTNYYLDVLVITNKRFIDLEQFVLFSRDEVIVPLEQIEDIKIEVKGVLATLLGYGNIQIQTAGATKETMVKSVMHPEKARACLEAAVSNMNKSDTMEA